MPHRPRGVRTSLQGTQVMVAFCVSHRCTPKFLNLYYSFSSGFFYTATKCSLLLAHLHLLPMDFQLFPYQSTFMNAGRFRIWSLYMKIEEFNCSLVIWMMLGDFGRFIYQRVVKEFMNDKWKNCLRTCSMIQSPHCYMRGGGGETSQTLGDQRIHLYITCQWDWASQEILANLVSELSWFYKFFLYLSRKFRHQNMCKCTNAYMTSLPSSVVQRTGWPFLQPPI